MDPRNTSGACFGLAPKSCYSQQGTDFWKGAKPRSNGSHAARNSIIYQSSFYYIWTRHPQQPTCSTYTKVASNYRFGPKVPPELMRTQRPPYNAGAATSGVSAANK